MRPPPANDRVTPPSLRRRLACNLYDGLLLSAVLFVAAFPFATVMPQLPAELAIALMRAYLFVVAGLYFTVFWRKGQTLAMKTWGIALVDQRGGAPSLAQVWLRYVLACLNLALLGIGWWAALLREDRQFLQDHYAGTRLLRQSTHKAADKLNGARSTIRP